MLKEGIFMSCNQKKYNKDPHVVHYNLYATNIKNK